MLILIFFHLDFRIHTAARITPRQRLYGTIGPGISPSLPAPNSWRLLAGYTAGKDFHLALKIN
jgi:hypothetical protein